MTSEPGVPGIPGIVLPATKAGQPRATLYVPDFALVKVARLNDLTFLQGRGQQVSSSRALGAGRVSIPLAPPAPMT